MLSALAFRSKAFWGYDDEFMSACREELSVSGDDIRNSSFAYWVCEVAGAVAGFYGLQRQTKHRYELVALFVGPNRIGTGIGKALVEHAKDVARTAGATAILIQGDPNAAGFYKAVGAVEIGQRESGSIPGRFLPEFEIDLAAKYCS